MTAASSRDNLRNFVIYTLNRNMGLLRLPGPRMTLKHFKGMSYSDLVEYCCRMDHVPALRQGLESIMF